MSAQVIDLAAWREAHRPPPKAAPQCPRPQPPIYWPGAIAVGLLLAAWLVIAIGVIWLRHR